MTGFKDTSDMKIGEELESDRLPDEVGEAVESDRLPDEVGEAAESDRLPDEVGREKIGEFSQKELQKIRTEHPGWSDKLISELGTMRNYKDTCKALEEDAELLGLEEKYDERHITLYKDDKGNLYRVNNTMLPNRKYELNGYKYKTDGLGRRILAEGILYIKKYLGRLPIRDSKEAIGQGNEKNTDDRGHMIGDRFGGPNGMENMIPQDCKINQIGYKKLENQLAEHVKAGKEVYLKVQPRYQGDSFRPTAIIVTYTVDGRKEKVVFSNGGK